MSGLVQPGRHQAEDLDLPIAEAARAQLVRAAGRWAAGRLEHGGHRVGVEAPDVHIADELLSAGVLGTRAARCGRGSFMAWKASAAARIRAAVGVAARGTRGGSRSRRAARGACRRSEPSERGVAERGQHALGEVGVEASLFPLGGRQRPVLLPHRVRDAGAADVVEEGRHSQLADRERVEA